MFAGLFHDSGHAGFGNKPFIRYNKEKILKEQRQKEYDDAVKNGEEPEEPDF